MRWEGTSLEELLPQPALSTGLRGPGRSEKLQTENLAKSDPTKNAAEQIDQRTGQGTNTDSPVYGQLTSDSCAKARK